MDLSCYLGGNAALLIGRESGGVAVDAESVRAQDLKLIKSKVIKRTKVWKWVSRSFKKSKNLKKVSVLAKHRVVNDYSISRERKIWFSFII